MPRQVDPQMPLDDVEDEILFTRGALRADPDARDLLPLTDGWLPKLDVVRAADRGVRETAANTDAARIVANARLDQACEAFGKRLAFEVDGDSKSPRWTTFFDLALSRFVKRAFGDQVARVKAWLSSSDPVLEQHRADLAQWSAAGDQALVDTRALAGRRGENWQRREELAADLTRERDAVHDALSQRGREKELPRTWPDVFFKVTPRRGGPADVPSDLPPEP